MLRHGVTVTGAVLVAAIALALGFDHDAPSRFQATTDISWIPALDIRIHLGIDGISLPLLLMTALLFFLCAVYSYFKLPEGPSPKAFVSLLLVLESGTLATFAVLDLLLFFLAFEMVLIRCTSSSPAGAVLSGRPPPGGSSSTRSSAPWSCSSDCC